MAKKEAQPKKTETLTLRLDPKMKFAIELLARDQKRTLAGVIEWAVQKAMAGREVITGSGKGSLQQLVDKVWSPDDLERVIYLGAYAESLLSFEESCIWSVVKTNPLLMDVHEVDDDGRVKKFTLHRAAVAYARDLIGVKAKELSEHGSVSLLTLEEINKASGGAYQVWSLLADQLQKQDGNTEFDLDHLPQAIRPEDFGKFS